MKLNVITTVGVLKCMKGVWWHWIDNCTLKTCMWSAHILIKILVTEALYGQLLETLKSPLQAWIDAGLLVLTKSTMHVYITKICINKKVIKEKMIY
jgi:hypothetical protein